MRRSVRDPSRRRRSRRYSPGTPLEQYLQRFQSIPDSQRGRQNLTEEVGRLLQRRRPPSPPPPGFPVSERWLTKPSAVDEGNGDSGCCAKQDCLYYNLTDRQETNIIDCPDDAVLYVVPCGHLFHNNCLLAMCEKGQAVCPISGKRLLEHVSEDVWAFKNKAFTDETVDKLQEDVRRLYHGQE